MIAERLPLLRFWNINSLVHVLILSTPERTATESASSSTHEVGKREKNKKVFVKTIKIMRKSTEWRKGDVIRCVDYRTTVVREHDIIIVTIYS
jgi:hypothetical protein